jgi:hypothetical protein
VWMLEHADELDAALERLYNELVTTDS